MTTNNQFNNINEETANFVAEKNNITSQQAHELFSKGFDMCGNMMNENTDIADLFSRVRKMMQEQLKGYKEAGATSRSERRNEKIACDKCGSIITHRQFNKHIKTKKCQKLSLSKENNREREEKKDVEVKNISKGNCSSLNMTVSEYKKYRGTPNHKKELNDLISLLQISQANSDNANIDEQIKKFNQFITAEAIGMLMRQKKY